MVRKQMLTRVLGSASSASFCMGPSARHTCWYFQRRWGYRWILTRQSRGFWVVSCQQSCCSPTVLMTETGFSLYFKSQGGDGFLLNYSFLFTFSDYCPIFQEVTSPIIFVLPHSTSYTCFSSGFTISSLWSVWFISSFTGGRRLLLPLLLFGRTCLITIFEMGGEVIRYKLSPKHNGQKWLTNFISFKNREQC